MGPLNLIVLALTTVLSFSVIYAPQPLLPVLMGEFGVDKSRAALLITVVFFFLSIAPIFYGWVLEAFSSKRLMRLSILALGITELFFFSAKSFSSLMLIRVAQGMLVPALLTSLMTYISTVSEDGQVQKMMAFYIAATILGGFLGRSVSGLISTYFGWRYSFLMLGISLLCCFFLLGALRQDTRMEVAKPSLRAMVDILGEGRFRSVYLIIFCVFLAFASLLNFLPFRLTELGGRTSELKIGLMYSGYLMGIAVSLNSTRLTRLFGGEMKAVIAGLTVYAAMMLSFNAGSVPVIFVSMFIFCGGMFLVHSTASGYINKHAKNSKGLVNGLYVAFYYTGGTIGSYFPGFIYKRYGWGSFVAFLFVVILFALGVALGFHLKRGR
jgi:YNFM family putative membrane transporter